MSLGTGPPQGTQSAREPAVSTCSSIFSKLVEVVLLDSSCIPNIVQELREIFASAPTVSSQPSTDSASNRKEVTGDCPICFTEFEPDTEDIVWCKAACGNNIHKGCFEQWAKSQKGKEVRCVYW